MTELTDKNFGLLIAYVLPGFVTLWTLKDVNPLVSEWLSPSPTIPAGLESLFFVAMASTTAGLTISAIRWAFVDTLHHFTGLPRPVWDDSRLPTHLQAFNAVIEWHYRHYQFYSNMLVALAALFTVRCFHEPRPEPWMIAGFFLVEVIFVATSRDTLRKYYARTARLLGSPRAKRSAFMANGSHPPKRPVPAKPATERKKPSASKK